MSQGKQTLQTISPDIRGAETSLTKPLKLSFFIDNVVANALPDTVTTADIQPESKHNEITQMLKDAIGKVYIFQHHAKQLANYKHVFQEFSVKGDTINEGTTNSVPLSLQNNFVRAAHEGHQGLVKTKRYLRSQLFFPNINNHVTKTLEKHLPCQAVVNTKQPEPLTMTKLPNGPWYHLRLDLFRPILSQEYIFVVQCLYPRYPAIEIVKSTSEK